jgi:hypothetical protein
VVHLVRVVAGDAGASPLAVDAESVSASVVLSRWFGGEARRVYAVLSETEERREQRELVELIQRRGGTITVRDLTRATRRYSTSAAAEEALEGLVKESLAVRKNQIANGRGGWNPTVYLLTVDTCHGIEEENGQVSTVSSNETVERQPGEDDG